MTGVELSFKKTQVRRLFVSIGENTAYVDMLGRRVILELTQDYLTKMLDGLDVFYKAFTKGVAR